MATWSRDWVISSRFWVDDQMMTTRSQKARLLYNFFPKVENNVILQGYMFIYIHEY